LFLNKKTDENIKKHINSVLNNKPVLEKLPDFILIESSEFQKLLDAIVKRDSEIESLKNENEKFFGDISHDFRTLFNTIIGPLDIVDDGMLKDNNLYPFVKMAHSSVKSMEKKFSMFLEYYKALQYNPENDFSNFIDILNNSLLGYEYNLSKKNISLSLPDTDQEILLSVPKLHLLGIFGKLIDNAIKFTEQDGALSISYSVDKDRLSFSISNTGFLRDLSITSVGTSGELGTGTGLNKIDDILKHYDSILHFEEKVEDTNKKVMISFSLPLKTLH
jgi:signal transduction histidine kinase